MIWLGIIVWVLFFYSMGEDESWNYTLGDWIATAFGSAFMALATCVVVGTILKGIKLYGFG
jgi:hypothetical protein